MNTFSVILGFLPLRYALCRTLVDQRGGKLRGRAHHVRSFHADDAVPGVGFAFFHSQGTIPFTSDRTLIKSGILHPSVARCLPCKLFCDLFRVGFLDACRLLCDVSFSTLSNWPSGLTPVSLQTDSLFSLQHRVHLQNLRPKRFFICFLNCLADISEC